MWVCLRNRRKIGGHDVSKHPILCWELRSKRHTTGGVKLDDLTFFFFGFERYGTPLEVLEQKKDLIRVVISFLVSYVQIML